MKTYFSVSIFSPVRILFFSLIIVGFSSCILPGLNEPTLLERIQDYPFVSVDFGADIESNNEILSFSSLSACSGHPVAYSDDYPLEWDGLSFSANYSYDYELFSGERCRTYGSIVGTISEDGQTIESFTADETTLYLDAGDVFKDFITVIDLPYDPDYLYDEYTPRFTAEGPQVSNNIYSYSQSWTFLDDDGVEQTIYATTVNYNNPDVEAFVNITFSED